MQSVKNCTIDSDPQGTKLYPTEHALSGGLWARSCVKRKRKPLPVCIVKDGLDHGSWKQFVGKRLHCQFFLRRLVSVIQAQTNVFLQGVNV